MYYERVHQHIHENGPAIVAGGPSNGQPALPGTKKPHTPYTIEEILKPAAPRPRPPSPCGLLADGVCTCGLTAGNVVSAAFYVNVQQQQDQQFICNQSLHRYWNNSYTYLLTYTFFVYFKNIFFFYFFLILLFP